MTDGDRTGSPGVFLTGAAGFVGRYVLTALLDNGYRVVALQRRTQLPPELQARCERVLSGDIRDPYVRQEGLRHVQFVCHLSAYIPAGLDDLNEAAQCYQLNADTTLALATAASELGIRRFVQFSTGNMYAPSVRPCTESDSLFPTVCAPGYFVSKFAAEIYVTHLCERTGMEGVILRIGTPYGPGEPSRKVIPTFLRLAAQGQPLCILNGGSSKFNFVCAADVAECTVRSLEGGPPGIYNVASGEHTSLRDLADAVLELYGRPEAALHVKPATRGAFPGFPALSIEKARQAWRFRPRSLAAGLRQYRESLARDVGHP